MDEAEPMERFEDICTDDNGGFPWVTVFAETKRPERRFDLVDDNTLIIFCKLLEPPYDQLVYLGYILVRKTMSCQEVIAKITHDLVQNLDRTKFSAYLEMRGQRIADITHLLTTLPEVSSSAVTSV